MNDTVSKTFTYNLWVNTTSGGAGGKGVGWHGWGWGGDDQCEMLLMELVLLTTNIQVIFLIFKKTIFLQPTMGKLENIFIPNTFYISLF